VRPSSDPAAKVARETELFEVHPVDEGVAVIRDIIYGVADEHPLYADLFTPVVTPKYRRPAIVFLHGGCWRFGNKNQFGRQASYLAKAHEILSLSIDYRLSEEAPFPAALQDAKCAVRWLRAHAITLNLDPKRIAMIGGSAGAHLAALAATTDGIEQYEGDGGDQGYPSCIDLAVLLNGEFDLVDLVRKGSLIEDMKVFLGSTFQENPALYEQTSPFKRLHPSTPPILLLHGEQDQCVSSCQSVAMHEKLNMMGIHSELEIFHGKEHGWFNYDPDYKIVLNRIEEFLAKHFNLGEKYPAASSRD
jgi:acetyl esterase/lipase